MGTTQTDTMEKRSSKSLPFGYQVNPRIAASLRGSWSAYGNSQFVQGTRPQLWIDTPKATSRVEIQISIKLALFPFPQGIKKVHLQPYTISRPKFLSKPIHQLSPDTLELHASLVCSSALYDPEKYRAAMTMAAECRLSEKRTAARKLTSTKQAETTEEENPLNGAEVWICDGCVNRERKRNDRKKAKKIEDEETWREYEYQRIIVFNTNEIKDWEPFSSPRNNDEQRNYPSPADPPHGSMQVELPMRISCYCRHQGEKEGFRVIFTLKTCTGVIIAQNLTPPINITDDHKTASKDNMNASMWSNQAPPYMFSRAGFPQPSGLLRNSVSATDLDGLQQAFSRPQVQGFGTPFANPQNYLHPISTSHTPREMSRHTSPSTTNGPVTKKRKSSSNSGRLPESLKMTRLQTNGHSPKPSIESNASYPTSPMIMTSMNQPSRSDQHFAPQTGSMGIASPDSNGFGSMHRSSRSQSHENLASMQPMYSAPSSAYQSRAPSPSSAGPQVTTFGNQHIPTHAMMQMFNNQTGVTNQPPTSPQSPPLIIHKVIPRQGPKAGGVEVTVVGSGFFNGLQVRFGDAFATTTTFWGEHTLVCLLPPSRSAGKVPVTVQNSMDPSGLLPSSIMQGKSPKFEYIDNDEAELMKRALQLLGKRDTGRSEDAADIARRIIGQSNLSGNNWTGSAQDGTYRQATSGVEEPPTDKLDCEIAVLKCLDLVDLSDSPFPARYDLKGINGQTILHVAASLGYYRLVAGLLARGANPDARDRNGMSPMHMAALNDHLKIVRRLKIAGGDPSMRSLAGWTPADMANSHAIHFAIRNISPLRSSSAGPRPISSHSTDSMLSFRPRHGRYFSRDYRTDSEEENATSDDSSEDGISQSAEEEEIKAVQQWAASRRNSATDPLVPLLPSLLDPANHRYMQFATAAATAWRDQFAAQWHQLQQTVHSLGLPPIQIPDYQNHTNQVMRRFGAFRTSTTSSSDSKERLQNDSQPWWDYLTGSVSPPAYDEIYPANDLKNADIHIEFAARAALETEADMKCSKIYDNSRAGFSAPHVMPRYADEDNLLLFRRSKSVTRLRSDRKLFLIWIPLLVLVVAAMLRDRIPEVVTLLDKAMAYYSSISTNTAVPPPVSAVDGAQRFITVE